MSSEALKAQAILVETDLLLRFLCGADTDNLLVRALSSYRCYLSVGSIAELLSRAGNDEEVRAAETLIMLFQPLGIPMRYAPTIARLLAHPALLHNSEAMRIAQNGAISKETKVPVLSIRYSSLYSRLDISTIMPNSIR